MPAYGSYNFGSYDVKFDILEGNVDNAFDILKRVENGLYVGEYTHFTCCEVWIERQYILTTAALTCNAPPTVSATANRIFFLTKEVVFLTSSRFEIYIFIFITN